eukprot:SAG31_NODE_3369_length_4354_cov_4.327380_1_plen_95_part_00
MDFLKKRSASTGRLPKAAPPPPHQDLLVSSTSIFVRLFHKLFDGFVSFESLTVRWQGPSIYKPDQVFVTCHLKFGVNIFLVLADFGFGVKISEE